MLAEFLNEEDVKVSYTPPMEHKGWPEVVEAVVVNLVCAGAVEGIRVGIHKFRDSSFGRDAEAEIEDDRDDD